MSEAGLDKLAQAIRGSGLIEPPTHGVALLSGGADSACLAAGLCASLDGPERVRGLHVNYGLRPDSDEDEAACAALCNLLGIQLSVERVSLPGVGKVKARRTMEEIGISETRRVRGLGDQQRSKLLETFPS